MSHAPSPQQAEIITEAVEGRGNVIVKARAGTGKTTTLLMASSAVLGRRPRDYLGIAAYNNKIAREVEDKAGRMSLRMDVKTFHGYGYRALRKLYPKVKIEGKGKGKAGFYKFDRIAETLEQRGVFIAPHLKGFVRAAVSLAKQRCIGVGAIALNSRNDWLDIVEHFGLEERISESVLKNATYQDIDNMVREGLQLAHKVLAESIRMAPEVIDFDDMLYMPLRLNAAHAMDKYDLLMVDEAQDTNPARRMLARMMIRPGGRAIFVGDDKQAIYGFTGADGDALDIIGKEFAAKVLPLTVTYRCPKKVVAEAQQLVPDYRAHASAPDGEVLTMSAEAFDKVEWKLGEDVILCRNTKPLVDAAFNLIRKSIPVHMEGRDIGKGLIALVNRFDRIVNLEVLRAHMAAWCEKECAKLIKAEKDVAAEELQDRVDTIYVMMGSLPAGATVQTLREKIESLFQDLPPGQKPQAVVLMTAHRSKGLEFPRVFIYGKSKYMPSKRAKRPHEVEQEMNLIYVAQTRAERTLVYVEI